MGKLAQQLSGQSQVKVYAKGGLIKKEKEEKECCRAKAMKCGGKVKK